MYCLVKDCDGHWYQIPLEMKDNFREAVEEIEVFDDWEMFDTFGFEDYRLNLHISSYCFDTKLKEIE